MIRTLLVLKFMILMASLPAPGQSQETSASSTSASLVSLDTPFTNTPPSRFGQLDIRAFSGEEDLTYTSLAFHTPLGRDWEGILRGSFAGRRTLALPGGGGIRHGGSDIELAAKYGFPGNGRVSTAGFLGVSLPNTPAQDNVVVTLGLSAGSSAGNRSFAIVNPRAVFINDNVLLGIGTGGQIRLSDTLSLRAEYTPVISGDNTRSEVTGDKRRRNLYGIGVRYGSPDGRYYADIGFTNATGLTTGAALTPGLGGSGAFYAALAGRF